MLQLLYISSRKKDQHVDLDALLRQSRDNNARNEVTGLLYTDGHRFLQVLEGPKEHVEDTFLRIMADGRHHALVLLSRRIIEGREFGAWSMAQRAFGESHDHFIEKIGELCRDADPAILGSFTGVIEARRAA